ncbi:MAG: hypothetical protein R3A12_16325 [Ignavibacteria bacterium]
MGLISSLCIHSRINELDS